MPKPPSERRIRTGGRKILSGTFPEVDYLGFADIPAGTNLRLTFERTVRSKRIYLWRAELSCSVTSRELVCHKFPSSPETGLIFGAFPNPPNKKGVDL